MNIFVIQVRKLIMMEKLEMMLFIESKDVGSSGEVLLVYYVIDKTNKIEWEIFQNNYETNNDVLGDEMLG